MNYKTLPGAIFGKRLLVLEGPRDGDIFTAIIKCPYCGKPVKYGETRMISGIVYCPSCCKDCVDEVLHDREYNYERWESHDYQPYGVEEENKENLS